MRLLPFGALGFHGRRRGGGRKRCRCGPRAFEETIGKRNPEHRGEEPQDDGGEDGAHLFVRWCRRGRLELYHQIERPGKALQPNEQRGPGPDFRNRPAFPKEISRNKQGPSDHDCRGHSAPEEPKSCGNNKGAEADIELNDGLRGRWHGGEAV